MSIPASRSKETIMNKNLLLVLAAVLCAAPARAQELGDALKKAGEAVSGKLNSNEARAGRVRGSVACGGEAMTEVLERMDEKGLKIAFEARRTPSGLDGKTVKFDEKLPDAPRVLGVYLAQEVTKTMFDDMPECAEKYYMRLSVTAQAWFELGGDAASLPALDKDYTDAKLGESIRVWAQHGSEFALDAAGHANKVDDLMTLLDGEKDPAKIKIYKDANKRFIDFLYAESQFRQFHADQFKKNK
jgi:hypothetical protein